MVEFLRLATDLRMTKFIAFKIQVTFSAKRLGKETVISRLIRL